MHLYFMAPLNLYLHLTSDYNNNNNNGNNFALCEQSLFWLIFWLQIKSEIALKLHAAREWKTQAAGEVGGARRGRSREPQNRVAAKIC